MAAYQAAAADERRTCYRLISGVGKRRSRLSGGDVRLWPATLYGSLEELVGRGWLEELGDDERPEGISGRERFYRITRLGRDALEREAARRESLARVARARLDHGQAGA